MYSISAFNRVLTVYPIRPAGQLYHAAEFVGSSGGDQGLGDAAEDAVHQFVAAFAEQFLLSEGFDSDNHHNGDEGLSE